MKVGSLLLAAAARFAQAVGAVRLTLSTEITNQAAQALYEAEGWKRQTDFYVYNRAIDLSIALTEPRVSTSGNDTSDSEDEAG